MTNPISIEGQQLNQARLTIPPLFQFVGKAVGYVEDNYHMNVVLLCRDHQSELHPTETALPIAEDILADLSGPELLYN